MQLVTGFDSIAWRDIVVFKVISTYKMGQLSYSNQKPYDIHVFPLHLNSVSFWNMIYLNANGLVTIKKNIVNRDAFENKKSYLYSNLRFAIQKIYIFQLKYDMTDKKSQYT